MKKFLSIILSLVSLMSLFVPSVSAADEKIAYFSYADSNGLYPGAIVNKRDPWKYTSSAISSYSQDPQSGYFSIVPNSTSAASCFEIQTGEPVNLKGISAESCLRLKMKSKTVPIKIQAWGMYDTYNGGDTTVTINGWTAETDTQENWFTLDIPINAITWQTASNGANKILTEEKKIKGVNIKIHYASAQANPDPVVFSEIAIYGPDVRAKGSKISSKMDKDGKYEVKLGFDRGIQNFSSGVFKIGDVTADSATYDSKLAQATLKFDMIPDFPSEVTIDISGNMMGTNDFGVYPKVKVANLGLPEQAALLDGYTCVLKGKTLDFDGDIRCIYDKSESGQEISVFVAVYKDNILIDSGVSEKKQLKYKAQDTFSVDIADLKETEGLSVEIYIVDSNESGRPLAKVAGVIL